jgi:CRISPR system Cascade subunit CasC
MLASSPAFNTEAAAQVAHAISVHSVVVEDDFFTAVDDLNSGEDDAGASHLGETEFAAGLFYLYLCIDKDLLVKNLSGDEALANKTLEALIESTATVSPCGKQNSFASRARASYILCETGKQQPRSLSVAYLKSVRGGDMLSSAIKQLETTVEGMDKVYGACADKRCSMNAVAVEGSLQAIIQCATEA